MVHRTEMTVTEIMCEERLTPESGAPHSEQEHTHSRDRRMCMINGASPLFWVVGPQDG